MRGFLPLLLLFVFVPLAELYLLIEVGGVLGGLTTIGLCLFTAALGAWLVRTQGFQTLNRAQTNMSEGRVPALEMFEGAFIVVAGVLLLVPGLITDLIGFACLVPPLRRLFIKRFMNRTGVSSVVSTVSVNSSQGSGGGASRPARGNPSVIDADFERMDSDSDSDTNSSSSVDENKKTPD